VYPALAVVAALGKSADVLWVGGEGGMESGLVKRAGIPFESIPAAGVHGVGLRKLPGNAWRLLNGVPAAAGILKRYQPQVLFFTGGYVGVPVSIAGRELPQAVFVPDIEPALALRYIARRADVIAVTTEESRRYYPQTAPVTITGYPLREQLELHDPGQARRSLGLSSADPTLMVFGGSRGARSLNLALEANLGRLLKSCQILHLSGELDWPRTQEFRAGLTPVERSRYVAYPYLHEEMGLAFSAADLVVSRAGAASLGELPRYSLPAILVPYPHAWRYQVVNARFLESNGAAIILEDAALKDQLALQVESLLANPARIQAMRDASCKLAKPGAAQAIAQGIEQLIQERGEQHG